MFTTLAQIEATLNSRPLTPLDSAPEDGVQALTPGHFLVGRPLSAIPERDVTGCKHTSLKRWNLCQRISQDFWRRWKQEYIHQLNRFSKWKKPSRDFQIGDVVLCKDLPEVGCRQWPLAKVIDIHPRKDGHVRVVTISSTKSTYRPAFPILKS